MAAFLFQVPDKTTKHCRFGLSSKSARVCSQSSVREAEEVLCFIGYKASRQLEQGSTERVEGQQTLPATA